MRSCDLSGSTPPNWQATCRRLVLAINLAASQGRVMLFGLYPEATINPLSMIRGGLQVWGDTVSIPRWFKRADATRQAS
ncbi:MAG: hypothetical protein Q8K00_16405 [Syntrophales bacterium]|nr:hypothetical protein [Syntrophales bacterium]